MMRKRNQNHFSVYAWKQFRQNKPALVSLYVMIGLLFIGFLSPIIANEKPLVVNYNHQIFFPAFTFKTYYNWKNETGKTETVQVDLVKWKQLKTDFVLWPLIPYAPFASDILNANYKSPTDDQWMQDINGNMVQLPFRFRHWLGTGIRGEDVLSGLVHGAGISLTIGFLSMAIATIIGLLLGSVAGYFGDENMTTSRGQFWFTILGLPMAWLYAFSFRTVIIEQAMQHGGFEFAFQIFLSCLIACMVVLLFNRIGKLSEKIFLLNKKINVPVDFLVSRTIEILHSLPLFILIITIAAITKPSFINLMVIIGLTSWTGIARLTRAEFLRIRQLDYIQAAHALGYNNKRIIFLHALPNALAPALVSVAFGVASAILTESSLSFLGIGVPVDVQTWGKLLSEGKSNFDAWWLVLFPGLMIFVSVVCYNLIGEGLREALDPRLKK